jgi:hypothetical protein
MQQLKPHERMRGSCQMNLAAGEAALAMGRSIKFAWPIPEVEPQ